ncbi:MAG: hypothetical protein M0R80_20665 [Proteobacteria bacterium]|jgi:hypothetical protein|nr:hypothetical protein [Pseudomonadota bacterium]
MMAFSKIVPFALSAFALGCSSGGSATPDADAGADAGEDTDTWDDLWDWDCTSAITMPCPDDFYYPTPYFLSLDLAALGVSAVHSARSTDLILAEQTTDAGLEPVAVAWDMGFGPRVVVGLVEPPSEPMRAVDLATLPQLSYSSGGLSFCDSALGYAALALLCGETACALYGLAVDEYSEPVGFVPVPGGEVPLPEAHALVGFPEVIHPYNDWGPLAKACAAGDGIACFDGSTWTEEVSPGGEILRSIVVAPQGEEEPGYLVAAGDGGRILTNRTGWWIEIDSGTTMDFLSLSADGGAYAAGGPGGFVYGDGEHIMSCASESTFSAMLIHSDFLPPWSGNGVSALAEDRVVEVYSTGLALAACYRPIDFAGTPHYAGPGPFPTDSCDGHAVTTGAVYRRTEQEAGGY